MTLLYRVRATISGPFGSPGLSTTYHRCPAPPTLAAAQAASDRVRGSWDVVKTVLSNTCTVQMQPGVDVIDDADGSLDASFGTTPLGIVTGTAAVPIGPPQVMAGLVLSTSTVVDGRRLRGRLYIGPLANTTTVSVAPAGGLLTAVQAMGTALITVAPPAATAPIMVWHRPLKNSSGVVTRLGSSSEVLAANVAPKWFTLRSRLN